MKIDDLIACLERKRADIGETELEFVICTSDGGVIAMDVEKQAKAIKAALKFFNGV